MYLVVDSGSTKTEWALVDGESISNEITQGINPRILSEEQIVDRLKESRFLQLPDLEKIFFYGAGTSGLEMKKKLKGAFQMVSPHAIEVEHDLLGAIRSFNVKEKTVVCILGTGTNVCVTENFRVIDGVKSLGYILADEGSGFDIGKRLINALNHKQLKKDIVRSLTSDGEQTMDDLIDLIYSSPNPNRVVAGFVKKAMSFLQDSDIQNIVKESFRAFFENQLLRVCESHPNIPINFVGSIAHSFKDILENLLRQHGLNLGQILKNPMPGLILYHQTKLLEK
ncbi:MAG: hypothetical protein MRY83_17915 [Flavobacteriales bacterium]|nr:hypothetical protein [Flavobacteriales bacterium]